MILIEQEVIQFGSLFWFRVSRALFLEPPNGSKWVNSELLSSQISMDGDDQVDPGLPNTFRGTAHAMKRDSGSVTVWEFNAIRNWSQSCFYAFLSLAFKGL